MPLKPRLNDQAATAGMAEIEPKYRPQEALVESQRCLYCFDAPCINSCPTGIDIPAFIKRITDGNNTGAARTILQANVLGASCARVCPTEVLCEGACVMLDRDNKPIKIGRLQRYATDHVFENGIDVLKPASEKSGKRVALIGAGPASLSCAAELVQLGHEAVVFEKKALAGGLNTYGMAFYKMAPSVSLQEVDMIRRLGVEIRENTEVGKDVDLDSLQSEFDAIFLGVGLGNTYPLGIPGEDIHGVVEALDFISDVHTEPLHEIPIGERIAVIGCGNTAIDAVTQALRLGAKEATIIYRRGPDDMPAYEYEYEIAKTDGAAFMFHTLPMEIVGNGEVSGMRLARTRISDAGRVEIVEGSEFEAPFDMVIKALGQQKMSDHLKSLLPGLAFNSEGAIERDFSSGRTNLPHVFAGGDAANGGSEAVDAVAEGKRAARAMHVEFSGEVVEGPVQTTRLGSPGKPTGAGFENPVRVPQLEETYYRNRSAV
jgi:dihydropyrimidine dehydrogenase (NAD+) subunit PreT